MKNYSLKKIDSENIKYFTITCGLLPGYNSENESYSQEKIVSSYKEWIQKRLSLGEVIIPGKIFPGKFVYGFKGENGVTCNSEDAIEIQGEIIREYCPEIFDINEALLKVVIDLATTLGNIAEQERVHITFMNEKYLLE
ncbi:MAG: hypothetical protein ACJATX_000275 [Candidatus Paceibacteria bacterium]|jgi:hypothetical protein